jgi:hypothetical protein
VGDASARFGVGGPGFAAAEAEGPARAADPEPEAEGREGECAREAGLDWSLLFDGSGDFCRTSDSSACKMSRLLLTELLWLLNSGCGRQLPSNELRIAIHSSDHSQIQYGSSQPWL